MSMRMYSKAGFHRALRKFGFEDTGAREGGYSYWKFKGKAVSVPDNHDTYPDYILDALLMHVSEEGVYAAPKESEKLFKITI